MKRHVSTCIAALFIAHMPLTSPREIETHTQDCVACDAAISTDPVGTDSVKPGAIKTEPILTELGKTAPDAGLNTPIPAAIPQNDVSVGDGTVVDNTVVDEIVATVYLEGTSEIVLTSDLRPRLDTTPRNLHAAVLERLMELDARSIGIVISEDDINSFLELIEKESGIDRDHINGLFNDIGYSLAEGREQVRMKLTIERVLEHRVRNKGSMLIEKKTVVAYYDTHPDYVPKQYELRQAVLAVKGTNDTSWTEESIRAAAANGTLDGKVSWEEPFVMNEDEVAADKKASLSQPQGSLISVERVGDFFELSKLVRTIPSRLRTLDERYEEISIKLQREQFESAMKQYEQDLMDRATIKYTHQKETVSDDL